MTRPTPEGLDLIESLAELAQLLTQRRRVRLAIRACWITGVVLAVGLAFNTWTDLVISPLQLALIASLTLLMGLVYAFKPAYTPETVSQTLDHTFRLDERLSTALELNREAQRTGWSQPLTVQAHGMLNQVGPHVVARTREPLRLETQTLLVVCGLCVGLFILSGLGRLPAQLQTAQLPELPQPQTQLEPPQQAPAEEPQLNPSGGERPARGSGTNGLGQDPEAQAAADAIADALRDQGATRAAADALDQGDTAGAAQAIRDLADGADQLSPQSRQDIADALDAAADQLQPSQPDRASDLRSQAQQIREGGQSSVQGFDELARSLEDLGSGAPQSPLSGAADPANEGQGGSGDQSEQSPGAGSGSGSQPAQSSRSSPPAAVPGAEVPLPPAADPTGPTTSGGSDSSASITLPGGQGSGGGGGRSGGTVPDDLSDSAVIPPELRDAIQDYFNR